MAHCSNCHTPMNDQMIFCPVCGQKSVRKHSRFSKKTWMLFSLVFLLLVGGGVLAYARYQSSQPLFQTSELTHSAADRDEVLPQGFAGTQRSQLADEELEDYLVFDSASPDSLYRFLSVYTQRLPSLNKQDSDWSYYDSSIEDYSPYSDLFYGEEDLTDDELHFFGNRLDFSEDDPYSYVTLQDMTFDSIELISKNQFHVQTTETYSRKSFAEEDKQLHKSITNYELSFDDGTYTITSVKRSFKKEIKS
ncbi:zinc ribbon domain-containing protein [Exiguobacterium artemiae]|uniref:zinc ribbon domain-containing protein n=1 Tax=Exiguobacterium artemiae TaxID=340145 RepID=UPI002964A875|nr:zinc ribbon domain-containing protein [Exiguobacterium sibiricum]MDW2886331.1 zinc ribbon domain-containing protein [Exiguobacterium sibiricum]